VGQKIGLFLRSDNFAMTDDRKACDISKVSKFCPISILLHNGIHKLPEIKALADTVML